MTDIIEAVAILLIGALVFGVFRTFLGFAAGQTYTTEELLERRRRD